MSSVFELLPCLVFAHYFVSSILHSAGYRFSSSFVHLGTISSRRHALLPIAQTILVSLPPVVLPNACAHWGRRVAPSSVCALFFQKASTVAVQMLYLEDRRRTGLPGSQLRITKLISTQYSLRLEETVIRKQPLPCHAMETIAWGSCVSNFLGL